MSGQHRSRLPEAPAMPGSRRNARSPRQQGLTRQPGPHPAWDSPVGRRRHVHMAVQATLPSRSPAPAAWAPARLSESKDETSKQKSTLHSSSRTPSGQAQRVRGGRCPQARVQQQGPPVRSQDTFSR